MPRRATGFRPPAWRVLQPPPTVHAVRLATALLATAATLTAATTSATPLDGVAGVSLGAADGYADLAANLRFNPAGRVDARRGARYAAATPFTSAANTAYEVVLTVNVATRRYSATIAAPGGAPVAIASDYAFRDTQAGVTALDHVNVHGSGGFLTLTDIVVESP